MSLHFLFVEVVSVHQRGKRTRESEKGSYQDEGKYVCVCVNVRDYSRAKG